MIDDDFMEWLKDLPAFMFRDLWEMYLMNEFAERHDVPQDGVGMSIQGDNFRLVFTSTQQPKKPTPITDEEIARLYTYILKNNLKGIDNTAT